MSISRLYNLKLNTNFNAMKKLIYLLFIITFISCNKSDDSPVSKFAGNYKIVSIISENAVDLNNDGFVSIDVYL